MNKTTSESKPEINKMEFRQAEYDKAWDTYKTVVTTVMQIVSGFVAVNVTAIGFSLSFQKSWLFIIGALVSFITGLLILRGESASRPFLMRTLQLEAEFGDKDFSATSIWTVKYYKIEGLREFQAIANLENVEEKVRRLEGITSQIGSNRFLLFVFVAVVIQILLAIGLPLIFSGWSFI